MTDVLTQTCARCGAGIYGTNFCENCGVRAVAAGIPATGMITVPAPYVAHQATSTTVLRVLTLLFFLSTILVPAIMSMVARATDNEYQLQNGVGATLEVFTGFFALLSAVAGRAGSGGKLGGALLALAYIGLAMVGDFTGFFYSSTITLELGGATTVLLLFLSWAVARPFRGPGYFGILVFALFEFADAFIVPATYSAAGSSAPILIALIACAFVLGLVGLSALFERSRRTTIPGQPTAVLVGGPSNGKARASLALSLSALALNGLSHVILVSLGLAISILALILLVVAIVLGHLARREIRVTGQRGAGMALAGMLIGYIVFGIDIALILAAVLFTAALVSGL